MPRKLTNKEYINKCKEKGLDLPVEPYINARTKIKHKCPKGHIYEQIPYSHLHGHNCYICENIKRAIARRKTPEDYYNECKKKGLDLPVEPYLDNKTKIKHKCKQGHIYKQRPADHLQGQGCPRCSKKHSYTPKEYCDLCELKGLDLPVEDYINTKTKIKHRCSKGHIYEQTPSKHLEGRGCFICNESHGEKYIRNYLNSNSIKYIPQKKFQDLKDKTYLSYDFYLPDYHILIEYQGIQHYTSSEYFGGDKQLEKQQEHDRIKRRYAKDNGYRLLELKYTLNTQELVDKYLNRRIKD